LTAEPVRWGVLGVARFALQTMIPAIAGSATNRVVAVASRTVEKAEAAAKLAGIPRAFGSYEALLADPEVEAVYIPLPNHEHVPWALRAAAAGKHVLCEKPLACAAAEVDALIKARDEHGVLIQESAMVRFHPRWAKARELVRTGVLGQLCTAHGHFSYFNEDPTNVRNRAGMGGGGLLDIGFYPVTMSRFLFDEEPQQVMGRWQVDPRFGVDRLATGILEFSFGPVTFTCSTQVAPHQSFAVFGTEARMQLPVPWSFPDDRPSPILIERGPNPLEVRTETILTEACHQWRNVVEAFGRAVRLGGPAPLPLEDARANLRVLDALARSCVSGRVETV
jgi:predicted dehydrogenase